MNASKIILTILSLIFSSQVMASEVRAYLEYDSAFWAYPSIVVDGKSHNQTFFVGFSDLAEAMKSNPQAAEFASTSRRQAIWGSSLFLGGFIGIMASITPNGINPFLYMASFGAFVPGAFLIQASLVNANRAINEFNGVKPRTSSSLIPENFFVLPTRTGGQLAMRWTF